ncbi:MAG: hypothetical protein ACTHXO_09125 [Actinomycetaceae bacterium]
MTTHRTDRRARGRAAVGLALTAALALAACGPDGEDDPTDDAAPISSTPTESSSAEATTEDQPEPPSDEASEPTTTDEQPAPEPDAVLGVRILDAEGAPQAPGWVASLDGATDEPLADSWELDPGGRSGVAPEARALAADGSVVGWDEGSTGAGSWNLFRYREDGEPEHLVYELEGATDIGVADPVQTVVDDDGTGAGQIAWLAQAPDDPQAWRVMSLDPAAEVATEVISSASSVADPTRIWLTEGVLVLADYDPEVGGYAVRPGEEPAELPLDLTTATAWDAGSGHVAAVQEGETGLEVVVLDVTDPAAEPRSIASLDVPDDVYLVSLAASGDHVVVQVEGSGAGAGGVGDGGLLVLSLTDGTYVGGVVDVAVSGGAVAGGSLWIAADGPDSDAPSGLYSVDLAGGETHARSDFPAGNLEVNAPAVLADRSAPDIPDPLLVWTN